MKKTLSFMLTMLLLCCAVLLAACGDKQESNPPEPCEVHTFGEWQTVTAATCVDGEEKRTCTVCGHEEKKALPADKAHTYVNKVCTVCGDRQPTEGLEYMHLLEEFEVDAYGVIGLGSAANETEIVIPQTHEGKPVILCAYNLFRENTNITYVECPAILSEYAFYGCTALQTVILYELDRAAIGEELYEELTGDLQGCLIGESAFEGCTALTSISIPTSVPGICENAFKGCTNLIQLENGVSYVDKWVISCDDTATAVTLRADTVGIATGAFKNCTQLASVGTLPSSLCYINEEAFENCSALAAISIPASVKEIGDDAFDNCTNLATVTFAKNCPIAFISFSGCTNLVNVTLPQSVTDISFYDCTNLASVALPDDVTDISFRDCTNLASIVLPDGVTDISFRGCTNLASIIIPESVTEIKQGAFMDCTSLTSISLPAGVTTLLPSTFRGCTNLTSIVIPSSMNIIDYGTFFECVNLATVYYCGNINDWENIDILSTANDTLISAAKYYYAATKPTENHGAYWHYVNGTPTVWTEQD